MAAVFVSDAARAAGVEARTTARLAGHRLDRFQLEAGRPTAVCSCGLYLFVERQGEWVWGYGRLPGTRGAIARHTDPVLPIPAEALA